MTNELSRSLAFEELEVNADTITEIVSEWSATSSKVYMTETLAWIKPSTSINESKSFNKSSINIIALFHKK